MNAEVKISIEQWLQIRKDAGKAIDPETAEVMWVMADGLDPYGVYRDTPEELCWISREHFARSPGSNVWVWFGDLPENIEQKFWEKCSSELEPAFVIY